MASIKSDFGYVRKVFRFMKPFAFPYSIGLFLVGTQSFLFSLIIGTLSSGMMAAIMDRSIDAVIISAIILVAMFIGYLVVVGVGIYLFYYNEARAVKSLKRNLFRAFVSNSLESSTASHSGESIAAINTDANIASDLFGWVARNFLDTVMGIVFSGIVLFILDWRLGAAAVLVGLFGLGIQTRFTKPIAQISKDRLTANADTVKTASNTFAGAIAIRAFNIQDKALVTFDADSKRIRLLDFKRAFITMLQRFFFSVQFWLSTVVVFGVGGWLVYAGHLDFHLLMLAVPMSATITFEMGYIGQSYANFQAPIAGAKRVFTILETGKETQRPSEVLQTRTGYHLRIDGMNFRYQNAETDALTDIHLEIPENQMVAFVGESGSGKSTLLRAIIGFYERDTLNMSIGGQAFDSSQARDWRRNFAYVDQSCKLFDMSVKENIAMGKGGKAVDKEIITAAKRAAAHDFIESLEGGYYAPCGEKGGVLSGGQKQRIAIARALIKGGPILIFDEATSALDKDSERSVMETIKSLRKDYTILITTHNLENIETADKIVVMDKGKIAETGTHSELIEQGGLYHNLVAAPPNAAKTDKD
ncbi:MAG: ABC transporter ATP-binding protein/permease [Defluviitaleaceae bacterium]|nr:ABC transporter ATP-binding protein/permease [Defluviitaleaceae bacterium]